MLLVLDIYLIYRSLHAIVQKRPYLLDKDFKFFFVKYNDPIYVKLEKLDILYKLNDSKNFENIMNEMRNYAITEFDNELVKKSIYYIGNIGLKFDKAVDLSIDHINEVMEHNQDFTVNHAIIVARDLLRKYKDNKKSKKLIDKINSELLSYITEAESKAAFLYILGEFCHVIDSSTSILEGFIEEFTQESFVSVRLQILTATIKNFVNKSEETESLIETLLQKGGEESENPDVRDRAYLYWRILENDPELAKDMILGERPTFELKEDLLFEGELNNNIIENMTNVSAVYHKNSGDLIHKEDMVYDEIAKQNIQNSKAESSPKSKTPTKTTSKEIKTSKETNPNFIGLDDEEQPKPKNNTQNVNLIDNIFDITDNNQDKFVDESQNLQILDDQTVTSMTPTLCIDPSMQGQNQKSGLAIYSTFGRDSNSNIIFGLYIKNYSNTTVNNIDVFLNNNSFGLSISNPNLSHISLSQGASKTLQLSCEISNEKNDKKTPTCPYKIAVCFRSQYETFFFSCPLLVNVLFTEIGKMGNQAFVEFFKGNNNNKSNINYTTDNLSGNCNSEEGLNKTFEKNNIFQVAKKNVKDQNPLIYYSSSVNNVISCIVQVNFKNSGDVNFKVISNMDPIIPLVKEAIDYIIQK